jgi:hypothetical protein
MDDALLEIVLRRLQDSAPPERPTDLLPAAFESEETGRLRETSCCGPVTCSRLPPP